MQEILISSIDAARIQNCIDRVRLGGLKAPINLVPLINELNRARKVEPDEMPRDVVKMNSVVSLLNLTTKQVMKIQIVYPQDADISKHKVSIFAPVGTALLGYRKGDKVQWNTPSGSVELEILDILNEIGE
jgi:regulator of nucleoside diphosphate kinase